MKLHRNHEEVREYARNLRYVGYSSKDIRFAVEEHFSTSGRQLRDFSINFACALPLVYLGWKLTQLAPQYIPNSLGSLPKLILSTLPIAGAGLGVMGLISEFLEYKYLIYQYWYLYKLPKSHHVLKDST